MITYRELAESDFSKIAEIDRSEVIRVGYEVRGGELVEMDVMWDSRNFIPEGKGEHTVAGEIEFCRGHIYPTHNGPACVFAREPRLSAKGHRGCHH
jgi:hypothetical protein